MMQADTEEAEARRRKRERRQQRKQQQQQQQMEVVGGSASGLAGQSDGSLAGTAAVLARENVAANDALVLGPLLGASMSTGAVSGSMMLSSSAMAGDSELLLSCQGDNAVGAVQEKPLRMALLARAVQQLRLLRDQNRKMVGVLKALEREGNLVTQVESLRKENQGLLCKYTAAQLAQQQCQRALQWLRKENTQLTAYVSSLMGQQRPAARLEGQDVHGASATSTPSQLP